MVCLIVYDYKSLDAHCLVWLGWVGFADWVLLRWVLQF
jgi:hypothetical protein